MTPVRAPSILRRPHMSVLLAVAAALVVAAHLGFFALALAHWHWTLSAAGLVALLLLAKAIVIVGHRRARARRRKHTRNAAAE